MAGNYTDPTSWKMALDRDGSIAMVLSSVGMAYQLTSTQQGQFFDEESSNFSVPEVSSGGATMAYIGVVFPEARDIDAYMLKMGNQTTSYTNKVVQVSTNTTNLQDGTWTTINGAYGTVPSGTVNRVGVTSGTALAVKGIRFSWNESQGVYRTVQLYGEIAPDENPDRVELWDALTDTKISPVLFDWGDVPRSSSEDRVFRVKNRSATKSAINVRCSFDILSDSAAPSVPGQFVLSYSGGAFLAQVNLGNLAPGAISGPVTVRRITPSNAQLGLWLPRVSAVPDSMT